MDLSRISFTEAYIFLEKQSISYAYFDPLLTSVKGLSILGKVIDFIVFQFFLNAHVLQTDISVNPGH
jgi:hypothetical protein